MGNDGEFNTETEFDTLVTTNKKVIPAINEVFQCADSTIKAMENAIGVPAESMSYLSESAENLNLLNERLRRRVYSSYETLGYKNLNRINKYGRNLLPLNFNNCKLVSEDGNTTIPINTNGEFNFDDVNITTKTTFNFNYFDSKYFKLPYGNFDLRLMTSSFMATNDLSDAIKVEYTITPMAVNCEKELSDDNTINTYKRTINTEKILKTFTSTDLSDIYNSDDHSVDLISSNDSVVKLSPFYSYYIKYNNDKIPLIVDYTESEWTSRFIGYNSTDAFDVHVETILGSNGPNNIVITIRFTSAQQSFYDLSLIVDESNNECIKNTIDVYNIGDINIKRKKIADLNSYIGMEARELVEPAVCHFYESNLINIKVIVNPSSDLRNKDFSIGIFDKTTRSNIINNLEYNYFMDIPYTFNRNKNLTYLEDSLFTSGSTINSKRFGRTMSDSIELSTDLVLTKDTPITLHMEDLPFYPTKVVFTLPFIRINDDRYCNDITLVAYENPLLQDDNSSNKYYDPYGEIYIEMQLKGTDLIFTTNKTNKIYFFKSDSVYYNGNTANTINYQILGRDYRYTAYADQSIKYIDEYKYSEYIEIDNSELRASIPKYFDMIGYNYNTKNITVIYKICVLSTCDCIYCEGYVNYDYSYNDNSSVINTFANLYLLNSESLNILSGQIGMVSVMIKNNYTNTFTVSKPFLVKFNFDVYAD